MARHWAEADTVLPRLRLLDFNAAERSFRVPEERWTAEMRLARERWATRLENVLHLMRERTLRMQGRAGSRTRRETYAEVRRG